MTISNGYTTVPEVRAAMGASAGTANDAGLEVAIEAASRMVDDICGRRFFTNGTEVRYYEAESYHELEIDDVAGAAVSVRTSSAGNGTWDLTWSATDFYTEPVNRYRNGNYWPITELHSYVGTTAAGLAFPVIEDRYTVEVTGVFGFGTAVPIQVKQATILLAEQQWKRYDSPSGVINFGDMGAIRVGTRLDPDVARLLQRFVRDPLGLS